MVVPFFSQGTSQHFYTYGISRTDLFAEKVHPSAQLLKRQMNDHDLERASRYIHCERPRCPECGGTEHKSYRSVEQADGSRMKWTTCKSCGEKFIVILE